MSRVSVGIDMAVPPDAVWAGIEDLSTHVEWMADAVAIRFLTEQRAGEGTEFECDTRVGPFRTMDRLRVTEWEPGRAMGIEHRGAFTGSGRFTLEARPGGGTRFTWTEELVFPWWMGGPVGAALARPVLHRLWRGNLARLRTRIEAAA